MMLNAELKVGDKALIDCSRQPKLGAKPLQGKAFYCYRDEHSLGQFYLLWAIVQLRRSSKASTNSTSDIFNADATVRIVSNVGDLVPFSHLDQVGASTPVISAKTEYESCENFPFAPVDELDNTIIQLDYNGSTPKSIVAGLQRQRCILLDRNAPRLRLCFGCPQLQLTEKASLWYWTYLGDGLALSLKGQQDIYEYTSDGIPMDSSSRCVESSCFAQVAA